MFWEAAGPSRSPSLDCGLGLTDLISTLATPTIPPMARQPFTNMLPDFIATSADLTAKGMGGMTLAGFWA